MRAALAQSSMTLWREKHRKGAIFRRKMAPFRCFRLSRARSAEQSVSHVHLSGNSYDMKYKKGVLENLFQNTFLSTLPAGLTRFLHFTLGYPLQKCQKYEV